MKNITINSFLIICILLISHPCRSQDATYQLPVQGQQTIVKYLTTGEWIIYYQTPIGEKYFARTGFSSCSIVKISNDYIVQDFEVDNDTVVFCGKTTADKGFIGWFAVSSFFDGTSTIIHVDPTLALANVSCLQDIELFRDASGQMHLAGYGRLNSSQTATYCAFEAAPSQTGIPGMKYRIKPMVCSSEVLDIAVTDNYVVLSGARTGYSQQTTSYYTILSVFPKYNMLGSASDTYYEYNPAGILNNVEPFRNQMKVAHISADTVAVLAYDNDLVNSTYGICIRTYDLSNNGIMTSSRRFDFGTTRPWNLSGLKYVKPSRHLLILNDSVQLNPYTGVPRGSVLYVENTNTFPVQTHYDILTSGNSYHSLTTGFGYLACGYEPSYNNIQFYWNSMEEEGFCSNRSVCTIVGNSVTLPYFGTCVSVSATFTPLDMQPEVCWGPFNLNTCTVCE